MANRFAAVAEQAPNGDGEIVLHRVLTELSNWGFDGWDLLHTDLISRAEVGRKKYGTYLRIHNGRRAIVDLYQELLDAIMYASQAQMEGESELPLMRYELFKLAARVALLIEKRG